MPVGAAADAGLIVPQPGVANGRPRLSARSQLHAHAMELSVFGTRQAAGSTDMVRRSTAPGYMFVLGLPTIHPEQRQGPY